MNHTAVFRDLWLRVRPLLLSAAFVRTGFVVDRFFTSSWRPAARPAGCDLASDGGDRANFQPGGWSPRRSQPWPRWRRAAAGRSLSGSVVLACCGWEGRPNGFALLFGTVTLGRSFGDHLSTLGVTVEMFATIQTIVLAGGGLLLFGAPPMCWSMRSMPKGNRDSSEGGNRDEPRRSRVEGGWLHHGRADRHRGSHEHPIWALAYCWGYCSTVAWRAGYAAAC